MVTDVNWLDFDAKPNFGISIVADATAMNALTPTKGRVVYRSDLSATNPMYGYDGSAWVALGGGGSSTGTDNTSFTIDEDNAGAGVNTSVAFNRGSTATDAYLIWNEAADRFELYEATGSTAMLWCGRIMCDANAGINLDGVTGTVNIQKNGATGDMEFTVATGDSFVFKTV